MIKKKTKHAQNCFVLDSTFTYILALKDTAKNVSSSLFYNLGGGGMTQWQNPKVS